MVFFNRFIIIIELILLIFFSVLILLSINSIIEIKSLYFIPSFLTEWIREWNLSNFYTKFKIILIFLLIFSISLILLIFEIFPYKHSKQIIIHKNDGGKIKIDLESIATLIKEIANQKSEILNFKVKISPIKDSIDIFCYVVYDIDINFVEASKSLQEEILKSIENRIGVTAKSCSINIKIKTKPKKEVLATE